jgi:hypothetical protein
MNSIRAVISTRSPHVTRKKRPITHGVYLRNDQRALKVRANEVKRLMRVAVDTLPWLREEHLPTLRKWAELETIRRAAFAGIIQSDVLHVSLGDVGVRRLVHDHRQLALAQLVFERELGMTPLACAQLKGSKDDELDLVAAMASADQVETVEPEPESTGESED